MGWLATQGERLRRGVRARWRRDPIPIFALAFAIFSFGVSIRSCQISERTFEQSRVQFKQERSLVLAASFESKPSLPWSGVTVSPIDSSFRLLEGTVYFPSRVFEKDVAIRQSGEWLAMGSVGYGILKLLKEKIPPEAGVVKIASIALPVLIKSYYATRGTSYGDLSLYSLSLDAYIFDEPDKEPNYNFTGLSFIARFSADSKVGRDFLDELFSKGSLAFKAAIP